MTCSMARRPIQISLIGPYPIISGHPFSKDAIVSFLRKDGILAYGNLLLRSFIRMLCIENKAI